MTDEEKIKAVTHALAGEFYPGQRVRVINSRLPSFGKEGVIVTPILSWFEVTLDEETQPRVFGSLSLEAAL